MPQNLAPVDSDMMENLLAKSNAMHAFQGEQSGGQAPAPSLPLSTQPETKRQLISVDVSIHEQYRMPATDKIIDAVLSTMSHTIRLLIQHDHATVSDKNTVLSFHAATVNTYIPDEAEYVRSAYDPSADSVYRSGRVHIYQRTESGDSAGNAPRTRGAITRRASN